MPTAPIFSFVPSGADNAAAAGSSAGAGDYLTTPIPANPVLDANSATRAAVLVGPTGGQGFITLDAETAYVVTSNDPLKTITWTTDPSWNFIGGTDAHLSKWGPFRIPTKASGAAGDIGSGPGGTVDDGGDHWLSILDSSKTSTQAPYGVRLDFWRFRYENGGFTCASLTVWALKADGTAGFTRLDGYGTGAGLSMQGHLTINELSTDAPVNHALFFSVQASSVSTGFREPALKTDGTVTPSNSTLLEGMRVQLDPSINLDAITALNSGTPTAKLQKRVARALQVYGAYLTDRKGPGVGMSIGTGSADPTDPAAGNPTSSRIFGWPGNPLRTGGVLNGIVPYDYYEFPDIPWRTGTTGNMRVLDSWNPTPGSATISTFGTATTAIYQREYPLQPPSSVEVTTGGYGGMRVGFPAQANAGLRFEAQCPELPADPAAFVYLVQLSGSGQRVADVKAFGDGRVQIRDFNTVRYTSGPGVATSYGRYSGFLHAQPGSATGLRGALLIGSNRYGTAYDVDSGNLALTGQTATTVVDAILFGQTPVGSTVGRVDLVGRVDVTADGTDPGSPYGTAPAAPTVTAVPGNAVVDLSWTPAAGQTGYAIYRRTGTGTFAPLTTITGAGGSYSDTLAVNGTTSTYSVRLANASGYGPAGQATGTPTATSTTVFKLNGDRITQSVTAVGQTGSTLASATTAPTPVPGVYIQIGDGGRYIGELEDPAALPAGSVGQYVYVLDEFTNARTVVSLVRADNTVIATDVERGAPGRYVMELTAAQTDLLTPAVRPGLGLQVDNLGLADVSLGAG